MPSRTIALGAAATAALTLAACGGSSSGSGTSTTTSAAAPAGGTATTQFVLAKAATATQGAGTARVTLRQRITGAGLPRALDLTGTGVTSLTEPKLSLTYDLAPLLRLAGQGGAASSSDATARIVVDGSRLDVDPPAIPGLTLPSGATWVRIDLRQAARAIGVDPDALGALADADPASQLRRLQSTSGIRPAGTTTIDGARVTRYAGRVTVRQGLQALPADQRSRIESALARLGGTRTLDQATQLEVDVDDQGRVRRQTSSADLPAAGGQGGGTLRQQLDYSDFGTPLDLPSPAGSDVFDATSLLRSGIARGLAGAGSSRG